MDYLYVTVIFATIFNSVMICFIIQKQNDVCNTKIRKKVDGAKKGDQPDNRTDS